MTVSKGERDIKIIFEYILYIKKKLLADRGETLINIPCWWDGKPERYF